jgi:diaminopimelate epimerase
MTINFFKYQGAGNDFIIIDGRRHEVSLSEKQIQNMCNRRFGVGADGMMLLKPSETHDFHMLYFNSDGKEGSLCGNGGRCMVRFARDLNIIKNETCFTAVDGEHIGKIDGSQVKLKIHSVKMPEEDGIQIIDTGSPHIIVPVSELDEFDVLREGRRLRFADTYSPAGTNVNFLQEVKQNEIRMRTYERGVEDETWACGTGAVAGALYHADRHNLSQGTVLVHMPGGDLNVSFARSGPRFVNIWLTGPAEKVFEGNINL